MPVKRAWLVTSGVMAEKLAEVNESVALFANADEVNTAADEVIVVAVGADAKDKAFELISRGIPATRLSYVDLQKGDDFFERIGKPKHLFWDDVVCIDDLDCEEDFPVWETGIGFLDLNLGWRWRLPELGVLCGPYGCGKSTFSQYLAMNFVNGMGKEFGSGALLCSWEDMQEEVKRNVNVFARNNRIEGFGKKIHFVRRKQSSERLVSWFFDLVRYHKTRYGTRFFVLDPWNEMDHKRDPKVLETDYVKDILREFRDLVEQEQIINLIDTHVPGKYINGDGSIAPFKAGNAFGCYSDDTEVLTRRGWLPHAHITLSDEVACFDPGTENMSWQSPSAVHRYEYTGEMHRYYGYGLDLLVTPNHRMLVKPAWLEPKGRQARTGIGRPVRFEKEKWQFCLSEDLPSSKFWLPKGGKPIAGADPETILGYPAEAFMRVLGWYIAEGSTADGRGVTIAQATETSAPIVEALADCGLSYAPVRATPGGNGGTKPITQFYIGVRANRPIVEWLKQTCGRGAAQKRIPEAVFDLSPRLKRAFLDAYLAGDGHVNPERGTASACTTSGQLFDDLLRLAVELGIPVTGSKRSWRKNLFHSASYQVYFGRPSRLQIGLETKRTRTVQPYSGDVWCLTVPTGAYVVRRNGAVSVCGNSSNFGNKVDRGICMARTKLFEKKRGHTVIRLDKAKVERKMGRRGTVAAWFDEDNFCFNYDGLVTSEVQDIWKD